MRATPALSRLSLHPQAPTMVFFYLSWTLRMAMVPRGLMGQEPHCWACWITLAWGKGQEGAETSFPPCIISTENTMEGHSKSGGKRREEINMHRRNCILKKGRTVFYGGAGQSLTWSSLVTEPNNIGCIVKCSHVSRTQANYRTGEGDSAACPSTAWTPQT